MEHSGAVGARGPHRAVIPASLVTFAGQARCVGADGGTPAQGPLIELVRENDVIRAIDITCTCGQRVRVLCTYD